MRTCRLSGLPRALLGVSLRGRDPGADEHLAELADLGVDTVCGRDADEDFLLLLDSQVVLEDQRVMLPVQRPTAPNTPPATISANRAISVGVNRRLPCSLRALT